MSKQIKRLNQLTINRPMTSGRHPDGNNLYLQVSPTGSKSWTLLYTHRGQRRELGLGKYPVVTLADARQRANEAAQLRQQGLDPKSVWAAERMPERRPVTFGEIALELIEDRRGGWRNPKSAAQWESSLRTYAAKIWNMPVTDIGIDDVRAVLRPIWMIKAETAKRVRGRIERVLGAARVRGLRKGDNPAAWVDNLSHLLPTQPSGPLRHQPAMPYDDLPAFVKLLRARSELSARALELTILTACRTSEVRLATWDEFDLSAGIWSIPADRMKMARDHRVSLSSQAIALVNNLKPKQGLLFPGLRPGKPISNMTMLQLMKRMRFADYTVHGFRSSFSTWAAEKTDFPRDLVELSLAHLVGSDVERAYRRSDGLEKRGPLMQAWADHAFSIL